MSWVQLHAAVTHFPIALLITALGAEAVAAFLRRSPEKAAFWRQASLLMLGIGFAGSLGGLFTGYFTGRDFARPPVEFQAHWIFAVAVAVLSGVLFLWRLGLRDRLPGTARVVGLVVLAITVGAVAYTGHLGGQMVFGSESSEPEITALPSLTPAPEAENERVALAAERMELAAGRLDLATDRMAAAKGGKPVPPPRAVPPKVIVRDSPAAERAAATLERVADQYTQIAEKLEKAAAKLEKAQGTAPAPTKPAPTKTTPVTAPAGPDPTLVAEGEKYYLNDDIGCTGCHKLNGKGGRSGPDLTGEGRRHPDIEWQKAHLIKPSDKVPGSKMPAYNDLTEAQLNALAHYMVSLK